LLNISQHGDWHYWQYMLQTAASWQQVAVHVAAANHGQSLESLVVKAP
jgi:hypothetical protein